MMTSVCIFLYVLICAASEAESLCGTSAMALVIIISAAVSELGLSTGKIYSHLFPQLITCCCVVVVMFYI